MTEVFDNKFSALLRELIHALRLKDIEFAKKAGIKKATLSNYVNGKSFPDWIVLRNIVLSFNVDPHWLLTGEGEMFPSPTPAPEPASIPPEELSDRLTPEQRNMLTYMRLQTELGMPRERIAKGVEAIVLKGVGERREYPTAEPAPDPGYHQVHDEIENYEHKS